MQTPDPVQSSSVRAHLKKPQVSALYLTDALASGQSDEIIAAFRDIRRAVQDTSQQKIRNLEMTLKEAIEIMDDADLQLVAIRKPRG